MLKAEQVRIVLVETMGEANLGSVARTLSCFGIEDWWLVRPRRQPSQVSLNWACHGQAWLERVQFCQTLPEALAGIDLAVAVTGKSGKRRHRLVTPPQLVQEVLPRFQLGRLALVFGNEESGLDNSDIALCHWRVKIATDPVHTSLNLAQAVTLLVYEVVGRGLSTDLGSKPLNLASPQELQQALKVLGDFLSRRGYPTHQASLPEELRKVNDLLHRSRPESWEVNFLLGMLRQLDYLGRDS